MGHKKSEEASLTGIKFMSLVRFPTFRKNIKMLRIYSKKEFNLS